MKCLILISFIAISAISCEKKFPEIVKVDTSKLDSALAAPQILDTGSTDNCFLNITDKDSLLLSLNDNLGTITGKMRYKNFEKDSSSGDIFGSKNGDTLQLTYTFLSEGKTSERDIYFLKKGENLIEGIGDHKTEGNKEFYANPAKLKYEGQSLKPTNCKDFDKNFKGK